MVCSGAVFSRSQQAVQDGLTDLFERAFDKKLLSDAVVSQSLSQEENLWKLRDEIPPEKLYDEKPLKWDVSVPLNRITDFVGRAEQLVNEICPSGRFYAFGHVGDGNVHTVAFPRNDDTPEFDATCADLYGSMDALVWSMDGSICAEHGVGIENVDRLRGQKSDTELDLMRKVKQLLDPAGVMNPGKVVPL